MTHAAKTTTDVNLTREQWFELTAERLISFIVEPAIADLKLPLERPTIRYSVTEPFTPKRGRKTLGRCYNRASSTAGYNEIFICATLDDNLVVIDTLLHELLHAYTDCIGGHGGKFKRLADYIGMVRINDKPGTEKAGALLTDTLKLILTTLPPLPTAAMILPKKVKEPSRLVRFSCALCDYKFHTTRYQSDRMTHFICHVCGEDSLELG